MSFDIVKHRAPSAWASYLINGDASGLEDCEQSECDAWVDSIGLGAPVDCSDDGIGVIFPDGHLSMRYVGEVSVYTFLEARTC